MSERATVPDMQDEIGAVRGLFDSLTALVGPLQGELAALKLAGIEVAETFPFCVVEIGSGKIISANDALCKLAGYSQAELVGNTIEILIPAGMKEKHEGHRIEYREHPSLRITGMTSVNERGVRMRRKDGKEVRVWIGLAPLAGMVAAVILLVEK